MTSPLAPASYPAMPVIKGVRLATATAGVRYKNRTDVMLALLPEGAQAAGVFTRSLTAAAPVLLCREHLAAKQGIRAIIVNSGNANAFTGEQGLEASRITAQDIAHRIGCPVEQIFPASTGVIAEPMDASRITQAVPALLKSASETAWEDAARAIMTTDAFPKYGTRTAHIGKEKVTLNGFAKGAGMIAPDMATMLAYFFTDASLPQGVLQTLLEEAVATSFNAVTVDGDTSTNDTLLLTATHTGPAGKGIKKATDPALTDFRAALHSLAQELAQMLVRDGEGATKFVRITVHEAENEQAARRIAMSIANSPLVKTAFAGEDPNWGRIVAAVGKAGERADRDKLWINYGPHRLAQHGRRHPDYREAAVADYMKNAELVMEVGVGVGKSSFTVWTCDLGHPYVTVNSDYRS